MLWSRLLGVMPVNLALVIVGTADMLSTIYWVQTGRAVEFNPIMAAALNMGMLSFVAVKVSTLGAYVGVIEWYRHRGNPAFASAASCVTFAAYVGIYAVSFVCVNYRFLLG